MQGIADDIVDQESHSTDPQSFTGELSQFFRREVMSEEIATHKVERTVGKGQREGVAHHCAGAAVQVRAGAIEQGNLQVNFSGKMLPDFSGNKTCSGSDFEEGSVAHGILVERATDEPFSSLHPAEPPVEHLKIPK